MMADVLGYPLVFPTVTEASALGAVILGWRSIGKIQSISEAQELIELKEQVGVQETDHKISENLSIICFDTKAFSTDLSAICSTARRIS